MPEMIQIKINDRGLVKKFDGWARKNPKEFDRHLSWFTVLAQRRTKWRLSGPVLNRRTGHLWKRLEVFKRQRGNAWDAGVKTKVHYGVYHELGGPKTKRRSFMKPSIIEAAKKVVDRLDRYIKGEMGRM